MHWFEKCNIWKKSLRTFRGSWGQEVILEVGEAKFWNSSNFHRFSLENFRCFAFRGRLTSATLASSEGAQGIFSKITFSKSVIPTKKMRYVTALSKKILLNLSTEEEWQWHSLGGLLKGSLWVQKGFVATSLDWIRRHSFKHQCLYSSLRVLYSELSIYEISQLANSPT